MQTKSPAILYQERINELLLEEMNLLSRKRVLAWSRLLSILAAFFALWQLMSSGPIIAIAAFVLLVGLFLFFVAKDLKNKDAIQNTRLLIIINKQELKSLEHQYTDRPAGEELNPSNHPYSNDLDIFGKASLYQYINRTLSEQGNQRLAEWLLNPSSKDTILQRQESAKELADSIFASQQLRAFGITHPVTMLAETTVIDWMKKGNKFRTSTFWNILRYLFPAIALTTVGLFIFNVISFSIFTFFMVLFFIVVFGISRIIMPHYLLLNKIVPQLASLQNSIRWIETSSFRTPFLTELKKGLGDQDRNASHSIQELKNILERFDYRFNPLVHVPLNILLLWDLQQVMLLEQWKSRNTHHIASWFNVLAEMESIISIATLSFNHPEWHYPTLNDNPGIFTATDLGHPLIPPAKRVTSNFSTRGEKQLNLVTGSNMAGKSTFLRSIGINIVLAMMGAPTCTKGLELSCMKVMSTMRINDNLEENTSTFYAELKKLKEIIDAVNRHDHVFLLLDEILRGTNSADRHTGSIALIRQLERENATGMIATHDLALTKLSDEFPGHLHNYHFDVQVRNEELYFDYKLKTGICTSMNASLLMKKIGIDM